MASSNVTPGAPAGGSTPPTGPRSPAPRETTFTRNLRYEFASEEGRALVASWGTAIGLGALWLLLVFFGPRGEKLKLLRDDETRPIEVTFDEPPPQAPPEVEQVAPPAAEAEQPSPGPVTQPKGPVGPQAGTPRPGRTGARTNENTTGAIGDAFGTGAGAGSGGMVGDVSNVLRGVEVNSGSGGSGGGLAGSGGGGTGGKTVLGMGQGGQGSSTPGRGGIGGGLGTGGGGGGGIGGVGSGGGSVARTAVRVSAPRVIDAPDVGRARGNVDELGNFVRSRESILRFCYQEQGLKVNPNLAGSITTAITLASNGNVSGVEIPSRTWSGNGASQAESCIRSRIRSWRFPSGNEGTYSFSFNFTR